MKKPIGESCLKDIPKILVVVPTIEGISNKTNSSLKHQTTPYSSILIANKKIDKKFSTGERASKALNYELGKYTNEELSVYDYLLRIDDDSYLPEHFIEENLKLDADIVGSSGYGQLIKMKLFIEVLNARFPEVWSEDGHVWYTFKYYGLKAEKYRVKPENFGTRNFNKKRYFGDGISRYKKGYIIPHILVSFREPMSGRKVGFNVIYIIAGYFWAMLKGEKKYFFSEMTTDLQWKRIMRRNT